MDVKTTLQQQMQSLHGTMEAAIGDCSPEVLSAKLAGSTINSIGAVYAHTIFSEDGLVNGLVRGGTPVYFAGGWAPKVGLEMPKGGMEPDWAVTLPLDVFRQYAAAVGKATSEYLASATDAELDRVVDPGFAPAMPVRALFANVLAWHLASHQGEISALKGVQGVNGLVFTH
jgi:hypothetical protein